MEDEIEEVEARPPSARRNLTLRNNAARQVAVNFMPSRQLPYSKFTMQNQRLRHVLPRDGATV